MRIAPLLAASVVAIGLSAAGSSASQAAQLLPPLPQAQTNQSLAQPVGYYWRHRGYWRPGPWRGGGGGYCWRWRNVCGDRWGFGTWRMGRCMRNHGC